MSRNLRLNLYNRIAISAIGYQFHYLGENQRNSLWHPTVLCRGTPVGNPDSIERKITMGNGMNTIIVYLINFIKGSLFL